MANYENLLFEVRDGLAFVTVNRPAALNALNTSLLAELGDVFSRIDEDEALRAAILTGAGKAFVAGADIAQMKDLTTFEGREMMKKGQRVMALIENIDKPVIAAINGFALGGGCELAMACDVRFASDKAKFGQPEVNLGIMPAFGGTQRLPRLVGKGTAKYLIFGAETIDAAEALRIGLVQKVFPAEDLLAETEKYARLVISKSPIGVKMAKRAINAGIDLDLASGVAFELEAYVSVSASEDRREGMTAFLEKRSAEFKNR
ncbi:MAG: enoyl-CoA hydratase/isomerase family protein [Clostridiales Family XIII bacterium]|jgi:enoyl-CoA hydratase|nr:enoyl-CoA hydratase/isomerase family protein [Clostridiales Family XIII bacterium]